MDDKTTKKAKTLLALLLGAQASVLRIEPAKLESLSEEAKELLMTTAGYVLEEMEKLFSQKKGK